MGEPASEKNNLVLWNPYAYLCDSNPHYSHSSIEEFTSFYRMTLQKKYASLKNEIILDLYNDPFLRLGLSYCLKFLQKDPQETAFRSLGLEKK